MAQAKKRKKFLDVDMPVLKKQTQLFAYDTKELDGKFIKYDLTRILKGKNALLTLKVHADEKSANSIPYELKILPTFMKKMVRKGTDYVEDSFTTECKDAELFVKPFLITRRKVSRAVKNALRIKTKEELKKEFKSKNYEIIFDEVLKNKLQKELSLKLKKIYPLSLCEIRVLKIKKEKKE